MAFFESEIVQDEAKRLFSDYQNLMQLGGDYGKFDREGKKLYIERMEEMMARYRIFMKRFELSEDFQAKRIDVLERLVKHPQATYSMSVRGDSMREAGIFDGDVLLVDRAVKPCHGQIVVAVVDGDFTVKRLYQRAGRIKLRAANVTFPEIVPKDGQTIEVWGVVTATIKRFPV